MAENSTPKQPASQRKKRYNSRWSKLKSEFSSWRNHYIEISDYVAPRRGRYLTGKDTNKGRKRNTKIIDSTGTQSLRIMAAGMMSGMSNPSRPWFRLAVPDAEMMEFAPVKEWVAAVEKAIYQIFAKSNFYNSLHNTYVELGAFGTSVLHRTESFETVLRYRPYTAGEYCIAVDEQDIVDTVYREFNMTVSQVVGKFVHQNGEMDWSVATPAVQNLWDRGSYDDTVPVIHAVEPRRDRRFDRMDGANKPVASVYFETGAEDFRLLSDKGFNRMPLYTPRWDVLGGDVYGRSPGMDALGDIKQLQQQQKRKAQAIDKMVNPPMTAPTSLRGKPATVIPGGTTYVDVAQGGQGFAPAYVVDPKIGELSQDMNEVQGRIRSAFYADLFAQMLTSDRRQMTATEVAERHEEKLTLLGPALQRLNTELFNPAIDDAFLFALEAGLLPPAPPELQGVELKVEYISLLAQAQQAVAATSIERAVSFVGNLSAVFPGIEDKIDADQAVDEYTNIIGVPHNVVRSDDQVKELRTARAAAQAEEQALAESSQQAANAKVLSETDTQNPNALTDLLNAAGGENVTV